MKAVSAYLSALLFVFIVSCGSGDQQAGRSNGYEQELKTREDSLFHDVMEGHDYGMERMGLVSKYLKRTQEALDSLEKLPIEKVDVLHRQDLERLRDELTQANQSMNTWMDQFSVDSGKGNTALREKYLEGEKEKMAKLKEYYDISLRHADSVFQKK